MVLKHCSICGRAFTKTEHFKRHERSHTRERPYECSTCEKSFSRSDVLFRHMKGHATKSTSSSSTDPRGQTTVVTEESISVELPIGPDTHSHGYPARSNSAIAGNQIPSSGRTSIAQPNLRASIGGGHSPHGNDTQMNMFHPEDQTRTQTQTQTQTHAQAQAQTHDYAAFLPVPNNWTLQTNMNNSERRPSHLQQNGDTALAHQNAISPSSDATGAYSEGLLNPQTTRSDTTSNTFPEMYFPWANEREAGASGDLNDLLQTWLYPQDGSMAYQGILHFPGYTIQHGSVPQTARSSVPPVGTETINTVPKERFSRVERCWEVQPQHVHQLLPVLWREIVLSPGHSLFTDGSSSHSSVKEGFSWGFDASCRVRLKDAFHNPTVSAYHSPRVTPGPEVPVAPTLPENADFPPAEILDIALGLFFRRFHPTMPFIHIPTFCAQTTPLPLLFVMCLIGLGVLGTNGATDFVSRTFHSFLQRVCADLLSCVAETTTAPQQLTIFTTAMLTLNLAVIMGDKNRLAQSQMLYVNLLAIAQQHGLFAAGNAQPLEGYLSEVPDLDGRWKAWSKAESAKRLIFRLLLVDSWLANHLTVSPVVRSEAVCIVPPCDEALFRAKTALEWEHLVRNGRRMHEPSMTLDTLSTSTPDLKSKIPSDHLGMSGILALVQIRILESYHRLIVRNWGIPRPLVPWHKYAEDLQARTIPSALTAVSGISAPHTKPDKTNCTVLWHSLYIMLLADIHNFELAAGRHGAGPAPQALENIAQWSKTTAARRACVHAAQNFKLMSNRRVSDTVTIHSVTALFTSALILGLYLFMVQPPGTGSDEPVELVDADVDWVELADLGLLDPRQPVGEPQHNRDHNPIRRFITGGGPISICSITHHGGYESARRVLLDFANLMEGVSKRELRTFTQVLHIMSDDLMNVDPLP